MNRICYYFVSLFLVTSNFEKGCEALSITMGLLKVGVPLPWAKSKKKSRYIRNAGVRQFISTYNRVKDLKGDELLWGDEIEYGIFHLDPETKKIRLSLRGKEVMDKLNANERAHSHRMEGCNWVPEYGAWMIEATPNRPYTGYTNDLLRVERNMRLRRKRLLTELNENEIAPTVAAFPLLGCLGDDGTVPPTKVGGPFTESEYIGDGIINPHPRFGTLTKNIRERRGERVSIRVPLYRDVNTPEFQNLLTAANKHGCCGSDAFQLWRYGKGDVSREKYGQDFLVIGCTSGSDEYKESQQEKLCKWLVNVDIDGCEGLFYRSSPDVIVPDADWPRNGDVVVGSEIPDIPGWIRLQNGYYLPMRSDDGNIPFLEKITDRAPIAKVDDKKVFGSSVPMFREATAAAAAAAPALPLESMTAVLDDMSIAVGKSSTKKQEPSLDLDRVIPAIHMDAMAFGMGCCCLQVTFQAKDVDESRFLYDQLAVLAPILMALTASSPIYKGRIADIDSRWGVISEAVDCRTSAERGRKKGDPDVDLAGEGQRRIYKSRYDSISSFIYQGMTDLELFEDGPNSGFANRLLNMYNDIPVPLDLEMYELLRNNGIDPALSQHIAHLFIRDPLVVFDGSVEEIDDETQTEHFESIQSTNWNSVRWKPPPPRNNPNDPHIGWRTEFRSMEMQLTDFENAAFAVFIVLITRVILTFDLNLYVPLSRVEANMQRAHSRGAAAKGKFFFRRHMANLQEGDDGYEKTFKSMFARVKSEVSLKEMTTATNKQESQRHTLSKQGSINGLSSKRRNAPCALGSSEENSYEEMTMMEIMMGKGDYYPGLIPLVFAYLDYINCDQTTLDRLTQYLSLIEKRATGELMTAATWQRNFIRNHKAYKGDSVVSDEIAYDLMVACKEIGEGARHVPELLGDFKIKPISTADAYDKKLDSARVKNDEILKLLRRYTYRTSFSPIDNAEA